MTVAAEWLPGPRGYRVTQSTPTGEVTWYRSVTWDDGRASNVLLGGGATRTDLTVPLDGGTVTYTAADDAGVEVTPGMVPPQPATPVLGLPHDPYTTAVEVVVETMREQITQGRTVFYDILDRNEPYMEPLPPVDRSGVMVLRLEHPGGGFPGPTLAALRRIQRTGQPLMLRTTCNERVEDLSFAWMEWTETAFGFGNEHGPDRKASITWRAVDPLWGEEVVLVGRVWAQVPVEFPTWGDVVAGVPTWGDLVGG